MDSRAAKYAKQLGPSSTDQAGRRKIVEYLKDHGLDGTAAGKYQLGLVSDPEPDDEPYRGYLSLPYVTRSGVAAIKFRCVQGWKNPDHDCKELLHPRFVWPSGQSPRLYNPEAFFNADNVIGLCEGEIDAITATEFIGLPTLGVPGASELWQHHAPMWKVCLRDYERVVYFADGDEAGKKAGVTVAKILGRKCKLVRCPQGEDVSSMVKDGRAEQLQEMAGLG